MKGLDKGLEGGPELPSVSPQERQGENGTPLEGALVCPVMRTVTLTVRVREATVDELTDAVASLAELYPDPSARVLAFGHALGVAIADEERADEAFRGPVGGLPK